MKHKYPIGTWVRFYRNGVLVLAVIEYHKKNEPWEVDHVYHTDQGTIEHEGIIEARPPRDTNG